MELIEKLKSPFPGPRIEWRVGSTNGDKSKGMALAYIDARDVYERLDEVVGADNWQCDYPHAGAKTVCRIGIRINGDWVWKSNGAGDTATEAEKGALSDALKRAAVCWGIGRYLYDLKSPWVQIEPMGRSFRITDSEKAKLADLAHHAYLQYWGPRYLQHIADCETMDSLHITMQEMVELGIDGSQKLRSAWDKRKAEVS